jgi:hypothetical protein
LIAQYVPSFEGIEKLWQGKCRGILVVIRKTWAIGVVSV